MLKIESEKRGRTRFLIILKKVFQEALNFIFPKECVGCLKEGSYLCNKCFRRLRKADSGDECFWCGRNLSIQSFDRCSRCQEKVKISQLISLFDFEDIRIKKLINLLREKGVYEVGEYMGRKLALDVLVKCKREKIKLNFNNLVVTSVPTHWKTKNIRGYNQAETIARGFSKELGVGYRDCLKKKRIAKNKELGRRQRIESLQGNIEIKNKAEIENKEIVLVDDFMITGSTLFECSRVLKSSGARKVIGIVIARLYKDK